MSVRSSSISPRCSMSSAIVGDSVNAPMTTTATTVRNNHETRKCPFAETFPLTARADDDSSPRRDGDRFVSLRVFGPVDPRLPGCDLADAPEPFEASPARFEEIELTVCFFPSREPLLRLPLSSRSVSASRSARAGLPWRLESRGGRCGRLGLRGEPGVRPSGSCSLEERSGMHFSVPA